jgi:hypothetical protein
MIMNLALRGLYIWGVKWPEHEADQLLPTSAKWKIHGSIHSRLHTSSWQNACLVTDKDSFIFRPQIKLFSVVENSLMLNLACHFLSRQSHVKSGVPLS